MEHYPSILVTGSMSYDIIMDFPSRFHEHLQPDKLHQINVSFVVDKLEKQFGGTGLNISYSLGLLDYPRVKLLSSVGKDGNPIIEFIQKKGVDVSGVIHDETLYSATGQVITDLDNNQIWGFYYGACALARNIQLKEFADQDSILVISANHPEAFSSFQRQAIEQKIAYLYDPGMTLSWNNGTELKDGVLNARWLVGNDYEISRVQTLIGMNLQEIVEHGVVVITTLGNDGVKYNDKDHEYFVPAYQPKDVIDPTGAGDAWRSGFLSGVLTGKSIPESLSMGNAIASFAVEHYGTANHAPTREQFNQRVAHVLGTMR